MSPTTAVGDHRPVALDEPAPRPAAFPGVVNAERSRRPYLVWPLVIAAVIAVIVGFWEGIKYWKGIPDARLPHSWEVALHYTRTNAAGQRHGIVIAQHLRVTLVEAGAGLLLALVVGGSIGIGLAKSRLFRRTLMPVLVLVNSLPIVAVAPGIVIWLGNGLFPKAIIAAILAFFPITVAVTRGVRDIPADQRQLFHGMGASRLRTFCQLELPNALTQLGAAMQPAAALAVVGAIVSELTGAQTGLAVHILAAASYYNFAPAALWAVSLVAVIGSIVAVKVAQILFMFAAKAALRTTHLPIPGSARRT